MKRIQRQPGDLKREFNHLLDYHIRKLEQLIKIDRGPAYELKYMLHALKGSHEQLQSEEPSLEAVRECIEIIEAGQLRTDTLPVQEEIINEIALFKMRYDLD